jgi:prepilin-type N-terminal cleavage/methylation domain-containing protein
MKIINNKGFTLVELIVVIAILSVVIGAIFSFFLFENKIFYKSTDKFDIQSDLRLSLSVLSKELRNSTDLDLIDRTDALDDISNKVTNNYVIIADDGTLKIYEYSTSINDYNITSYGSNIDDDILKSYFSIVDNTKLGINLSANLNAELFNLDTQILLNNFKINGTIITNIDGSTDNELSVRYLK